MVMMAAMESSSWVGDNYLMAAVLVVPSLFFTIRSLASLQLISKLPHLPLAAIIVLLPQGVEANLPRLRLQAT